ncbi:hypothetical protein CkaCkLH20_02271 [Colletotrichum karsti]|uniref:Uncharacterized protein n=1 Tax=Colletotrichum karsti TaxID=1095194 RepID=A0A9P6IBF6_9PEZI|nr:uncharacterized protein CkaCkLH20_02271 [Colletotrichum karsti]KAF9880317.1 hypothetical protein CkaCkLH20_02271 [Colletotrichum karsti]
MVFSIAADMASQVSAAAAAQGHHQPPTLAQEQEQWFKTLDAYKRRFEAQKETLKKSMLHDQQNLCHDLDDQARYIESQSLSRHAYEIFQRNQTEIRTHRLTERKQAYDQKLQDLEKQEKDLYFQHHLIFPVPGGSSSRNAANGPSATTLAASASRAQTPSTHPQAAVPHPQRPNIQAANSANSAPMPSQQNHSWQGYNQHPQHASPHRHASISMYQQARPMVQPVEAPPRMLPSNGRAPILGNGIPGASQGSTATSGYGQPGGSPHFASAVEAGRGTRVAIPPMTQTIQTARDDRTHMTRNGVNILLGRQDDLARQLQPDPHRQLKRKSEDLGSNPDDPNLKRARTGTPQSIAQYTITFNEVYQDGKAEFKHTIVKFEDIFYILKCDEHGVHFKQNALPAAAKHLHGASHNHQKKEHRIALRTIGFHVVDCTDELMRLNNDVVKKAFENGYKPLNQLHGPKSGGKRYSAGEASKESTETPSTAGAKLTQSPELVRPDTTQYITNPEPGQLYQARWANHKMYVVAAVGWKDLQCCGWGEKFCDLLLYKDKNRPACFVYDEEGIAGWAEGYRDGEPGVLKREVPVLWFEPKGPNRLGWVSVQQLKPFLLDDPTRPSNPDASQNKARQFYAEVRGYSSFEDLLMAADQEGQASRGEIPAPQLPSSASDSESSAHDVDMYDFGDNPPKLDDSDDEDYVENKGRGKDSDHEMADANSSKSPQPLRRSTQEVRPSSRLSDSSAFGRSAAGARTRSSAKKDAPVRDIEDVEMGDTQQTPSKTRHVENLETTTPGNGAIEVAVPKIALGTPVTPRPENGGTQTAQGAQGDFSSTAAEGGNPGASQNGGQITIPREKSLSVAATGNGEGSSASKSPSLEREVPKISPKLQVANLLNSAGPEKEKTKEQVSSSEKESSVDQRRPSPSQGHASTEPPPLRHPLPAKPLVHPLPAKPPVLVEPKQQHNSPATTTNVPQKPEASRSTGTVDATVNSDAAKELSIEVASRTLEALNGQNGDTSKQPSPLETPRSGSVESATRRSDPRMSISSALDDQKATTGNGVASGSNTPRILNLANDDRWRAVRNSESPMITPATIRSPLDRSAAASPVGGVSKSAETFSIDVASFSEGDKKWDEQGSKFLHFYIEDDARGVARSRAADGVEAILDAQQVKAAQQEKTMVKLVLKTGGEQLFKFATNSVTGSMRGGLPQASKFYRWVTGKNMEIEHLG